VTKETGTAESGAHVDRPLGVVGGLKGEDDGGDLAWGGGVRDNTGCGDKRTTDIKRGGACHGGGQQKRVGGSCRVWKSQQRWWCLGYRIG
jgi:hypothetical protein